MANRFLAWRRPAITGLAVPGTFAAGRMLGRLEVTLSDDAGSVPGRAEFVFAGPGDVQGLQPGVIVGRKPAPGTVDAEHTRVAHVEFSDLGLPWRYSPEPNAPALRPWLVLVLGLTGTEISVGGGRARIRRPALDQHPLERSAAWAHVHAIDGAAPIARILSPREPPIGAALTAVLVPAFVADGDGPPRPAWDGVVPDVSLPCYDAWSFRTIDEDDDFRAIAPRLALLTAAEEAALATAPERRTEAARRLAQEASGLLEAAMAAMPAGTVEDIRGLFEALPGFAGPLVDGLDRPPVPDDCRPIADFRPVATSILDGISPMVPRPPVVARVIGDFAGVRQPELAPPDLPFELDIPLLWMPPPFARNF